MDLKKVMVSRYKNVLDKKGVDTPILEFIRGIRDGDWQDQVLKVRTTKSKDEKLKSPLFRVSGSFSGQKDSDIRKHSGFIAMDLDHIENANGCKEVLRNDPFIYAAFISIGGKGLCLLFRIDGSRHLDAFDGIAKYLYDTYQLICDQSGKNVSRARFVSYDPHMHINEDAQVFKKYLPKPKARKINKVVFVKSDFDRIVKEMFDRNVNICEDYSEWVSTAYALISEFGEDGRHYYHTFSSMSTKYHQGDTDKQYDACLKNSGSGKAKIATIASIYYHAKNAGIQIYSQQTKDIIRQASSQTKAGCGKEDIIAGLQKHNNIPPEESTPVVEQVVKNGIEHESENIIEDIVSFLAPLSLRKNSITRNVEIDGRPIDDTAINTLFIDCKSVFDKATKDLVCSVIYSNRTPEYNPVKEFFSEHQAEDTPNLQLLLDSIQSDTENHGKWVTKWLVSVVASVYGHYSPLVLVLSGETQGTGKTFFLRYILPKRLRNLFAESKMDNGKDDEILMTKKLIIMDDEYGGKSKREEKRLKEITSKEFINVREPYGRVTVDLRRMAVFCGTSNETQILSDPSGNRRVLPIHILGIDHAKYNACDKEALWHELHYLYKSGYDYTVLKEDIRELNDNSELFNLSTPEEELIHDKIRPGSEFGEWMTITNIIQYLILDTRYNNLSNTRVGMLLTKHGFEKKRMKKNGNVVTAYNIEKITGNVPF